MPPQPNGLDAPGYAAWHQASLPTCIHPGDHSSRPLMGCLGVMPMGWACCRPCPGDRRALAALRDALLWEPVLGGMPWSRDETQPTLFHGQRRQSGVPNKTRQEVVNLQGFMYTTRSRRNRARHCGPCLRQEGLRSFGTAVTPWDPLLATVPQSRAIRRCMRWRSRRCRGKY